MSQAQGSFESRGDAFGRWMLASALGHAVLLAAAALGPAPAPRTNLLPAVVQVNLVAAPGAPPTPARPPPKPPPKQLEKPVPPPPPPPPAPEKVVIPSEPARRPEPEPKVARPAPKPVRKPPEPAPRPAPKEAYEDVLASLREEAGEPAPAPVEVARAEPLPDAGPSGGVGVPISAEEAAWRRRAKLHVHRAWVLAPGFRRQPLETEIRARLGPAGHVSDLRVTRSSGNPWYDESVERAIRKASPLPRPPEPGEWTFLFRPEDLFQ